MKRQKRRHATGFSYTGAGNKSTVTNRKPRTVFSEIKDKLNTKSQKENKLDFNSVSLSKEAKEKIKTNIRQERKKKNWIAIGISILILIPIIFIAIWVLEGVLFRSL